MLGIYLVPIERILRPLAGLLVPILFPFLRCSHFYVHAPLAKEFSRFRVLSPPKPLAKQLDDAVVCQVHDGWILTWFSSPRYETSKIIDIQLHQNDILPSMRM